MYGVEHVWYIFFVGKGVESVWEYVLKSFIIFVAAVVETDKRDVDGKEEKCMNESIKIIK